MGNSVSFNPILTTVASGSFQIDSAGLIQGTIYDDPVDRQRITGGYLANTETLPMWGGVGISELVPGVSGNPSRTLGTTVSRATTLTAAAAGQLTGFSIFNQAHAMTETPQSPVPLAGGYGQVNLVRLGSGVRLAVAMDPALVDLQGQLITSDVSWDFQNQILTPYVSTTVSSGTYNSTTGAVALTTAANHGLVPGDSFVLGSVTGTGSFANLDGEWIATAGTTGTTLNFTAATTLTLTITGGNVTSGGILPVKILDMNVGNSMTVTYNATTGFATWNRSGSCAVILI